MFYCKNNFCLIRFSATASSNISQLTLTLFIVHDINVIKFTTNYPKVLQKH